MDMMLEQFKTIFDRPEKVKKLRKTILNLAVRGNLVPQDINDEPAIILLDKIKQEKEILIKEKKIKKEQAVEVVKEEEKPYNLPNGWVWVRLGSLGITQTGTTPSTKNQEYFNGNIPFIKPADISENGINYCNESLTQLGLEKGRLIEKNSVMMVCIGGSIGKNYYTIMDCSCNQQINAITPLAQIQGKFIHYLLSGSEFFNNIISASTGSATPIINKSKWEQIIVQLPPLLEQNRIVEKIDSLMVLCDKLEEYLEKKVKYGMLSAKSVFNSIGNANRIEELEENLRFILSNFKELTLGDNAVKELKNCILQLAVQGKLVQQNPSDEPVEFLLKKIQMEKERLIKEKKIKKENPLAEISEEEKPYELQQGWMWVKLGAITDYGFNNSVTSRDVDENTWVLELEDIEKDTSKLLKKVRFSERKFQSTKLRFYKGDVLYCKLRPYLNKVIVADEEGVCSSEIMPIKGYYNIYPKYLMYMLKRPEFIQYVNTITYGTKMPRLGTDDARNTLIPLAPYNEQKRIVEKVGSLMALCDELEKKIEKSKKYSEKLMESILKNSFSIDNIVN